MGSDWFKLIWLIYWDGIRWIQTDLVWDGIRVVKSDFNDLMRRYQTDLIDLLRWDQIALIDLLRWDQIDSDWFDWSAEMGWDCFRLIWLICWDGMLLDWLGMLLVTWKRHQELEAFEFWGEVLFVEGCVIYFVFIQLRRCELTAPWVFTLPLLRLPWHLDAIDLSSIFKAALNGCDLTMLHRVPSLLYFVWSKRLWNVDLVRLEYCHLVFCQEFF